MNGESVLAELRRADAADIPSVTALQRSAYAGNRSNLGVEPLPLLADYDSLRSSCEIWLADGAGGLEGVLILQVRSDDLLLWSVATSLSARGTGLGNRLLAATEARARRLGRRYVRLYTGEKLAENIAWYERHCYARERIEWLEDRRLIHMVKYIE